MSEKSKQSYGEVWKKRLRILFKGYLVLVALALLVVVAYFVFDLFLVQRVLSQREAFRETFGGVAFDDFRPAPAPEGEDAGAVYNYALALMVQAKIKSGDFDAYTLLKEPKYAANTLQLGHPPTREEIEEIAGAQIDAMKDGLDLVLDATSINQGSMIANYDPELVLPVLADARVLGRNIAAKAQMTAIDGDLEEASEWVEAGLHFANSFRNEPQLICYLVRAALTGLAVSAAEEIFNISEETPPLTESLRQELDIARNQRDFLRTLAGEAAWSRELSSETIPIRLLRSTHELSYNRFLFDLDETMRTASPSQRQQALADVTGRVADSLPPPLSMMSILAPAVVGSVSAYDRTVAQCDHLEIALALRAYKKQQGRYPDELSLLLPTYVDTLPKDPFTGADYLYRVEGEGFLLYSVGRDLRDDGGIPPKEMKGNVGGDIVWETVR